MKLSYDYENDILYIQQEDKEYNGSIDNGWFTLDFSKDKLKGITINEASELFNTSKKLLKEWVEE